jgi:hypothetical protein
MIKIAVDADGRAWSSAFAWTVAKRLLDRIASASFILTIYPYSINALYSVMTNCSFLFVCGAEVEQSPLLLRPLIGLLCQSRMIDGDDCGAVSVKNECKGN